MNIEYTTDKKFTKEDIQELFLSVGWVSGQYPNRLYKALMGSSTVLTAWNGEHLAGLVRVIDDSELVAFMHYVLVNPKYQGNGIAGKMVEMIKENIRIFFILKLCQMKVKMLLSMKNMDLKLWQTECQCRFATSMVKIKGTALLSLYYM